MLLLSYWARAPFDGTNRIFQKIMFMQSLSDFREESDPLYLERFQKPRPQIIKPPLSNFD